jgi:hypothetical protein
MSGMIDRIKSWFRQEENRAEDVVGGGEPVATPPDAEGDERETSTNAQTQGAAEEPWPGND